MSEGPITAIVEAAVEGSFTLLLPQVLAEEFSGKVATKKYLTQRIDAQEAARFMETVTEAAEIIPALTEAIPTATRDVKDDYLLAYALVGKADFLVTGDDDLLVLGEVEGVKIVTPSHFLDALRKPPQVQGR